MRVEADTVFRSLLWPQVDENLQPAFSEPGFEARWSEFVRLFEAESFTTTSVVPLPGLALSETPLVLNEFLVLDHLTEHEITRCATVGILRPLSLSFPMIEADTGVGLRHKVVHPKTIGGINNDGTANDEGTFGRRSNMQPHLIVADILLALRLLKSTTVRTPGIVQWTDSPLHEGELHWQSFGTGFHFFTSLSLDSSENLILRSLWQALEARAHQFRFGLDRFSQAFDRPNQIDRLVDFVIAAESILLSDNQPDRGELSFRAAMRASKLLTAEGYSERDVFRLMRKAYDARSRIVHGGAPKDLELKGDTPASVTEFNGVLEQLVRDGLRKAVENPEVGNRLNKPDYWEGLLFP